MPRTVTALDWEKVGGYKRTVLPDKPPKPAVAWWWIPAKKGNRCSDCGHEVAVGSAVAFNHAEKRVLCEVCVDRAGISPTPSKRYLASRGRGKQTRGESGQSAIAVECPHCFAKPGHRCTGRASTGYHPSRKLAAQAS